MRRLAQRWQLLVGLSLGLWLLAPTSALACSGPPYDPNRADVVAEGWVTQVNIGSRPAGDGPPFSPVSVTLQIARAFKGEVPALLTFTDRASYVADANGSSGGWAGPSGMCGVLDQDPNGEYALIVFRRDGETLSTNRIMGAVFGSAPDDIHIIRFRDHLQSQLHVAEPPTIVTPQTSSAAWLSSALFGMALTMGGTAVLIGAVSMAVKARERPRRV
jgi:hypothetical protein